MEVRRLAGVVLFDFVLDDQPAAGAFVVEAGEAVRLGRVGDGDDLAVGELEQLAGVAPALAAGADEGDVDLVAGRYEAFAAEDVPRHDGEHRRSGGPGLEEVTPRSSLGLGHKIMPFVRECCVSASSSHR